MNSLIESLNMWGARFFDFAPPILWQSSLLIAVVAAFDFLLRRKIRPAVRYTLWFAVFVKLLLPPTLALPTGAAWWLRTRPVQVVVPQTRTLTVSYLEPEPVAAAPEPTPAPPMVNYEPPRARLSREAWALLGAGIASVLLAVWCVYRWRQIARCVRKTTPATAEIQEMLKQASRRAGLRKEVRLRLTTESMSPAVCGLFRPVVLLPQSLIERLTPHQLQAVLLHELIHLRRGDVWVNCAQTLLQIVYWWHPLLWFANARVRRVREEAVDDAVMFALSEEAEIYAPTLLEVAKLAFNRPLATLGLVGILESRNALRHRIERLLNFTTPRRVGVSAVSVMCITAFTALAVPMGEPPAKPSQAADASEGGNLITFHAKINPEIFFRNIQARAGETMHTTNDDWNDILVSILDGLGVDCAPPRNITFDAETGELTMRNTSQALAIMDGVMKGLNSPVKTSRIEWEGQTIVLGGTIAENVHGKEVLIEAQFYLVRAEDMDRFRMESKSFQPGGGLSAWWELSPAQLADAQRRLRELGVEPISSPRIRTAHGITGSLFVGDGTNDIRFECVPFVHDDFVNVTVLARTTGQYAPGGKGWPDFAGHTNCAIFSRIGIHDGDGAMFRAEHAGTDHQLIVFLKAKIVEPAPTASTATPGPVVRISPIPGQSTGFTPVPDSDTEYKALLADGKYLFESGKLDEAAEKLQPVLAKYPNEPEALHYLAMIKRLVYQSSVGSMGGGLSTRKFPVDPAGLVRAMKRNGIITNEIKSVAHFQAPLMSLFKEVGLDLRPPESVSFSYEPGVPTIQSTPDGLNQTFNYQRGVLTAHATKENLSRIQILISYNFGLKFLPPGSVRRTNESQFPSSIPIGGSSTTPDDAQVGQFVQDGKLLYQTGKLDEAERKLNQALAIQPDNQAALYYLSLIKQSRVRQVVDERNVAPMYRNLPAPNPYARSNAIYTSPERQKIYEKLNTIHFDKIAFPNLQLSEVVRNLTELTQRRDPEQQGISFLLNRAKPPATTNDQSIADVDLAAVTISLEPGLKDVRLLDVLEAIVKSADHPIQYSMLDYGIEFSFKSNVPELHTRTFKVDPNTFLRNFQNLTVVGSSNAVPSGNLAGITGGGGGQKSGMRSVPGVYPPTSIQLAVINFFYSVGVNLAAPKSVFYGDRQGTLTVHATDEDLELIEQAINTMNIAPPEVTVKVRFVEADDDFLTTLFVSGATGVSTNFGWTGILTESRFNSIFRSLQKKDHATLLNEGEVTTLSGRQANFQVVEVKTIVSGFKTTVTTNATDYGYETTNMSFGRTLDVIPTVLPDGYTISMSLTPKATEFLGYDDPKVYEKYDEKFKHAQLPLVKYRVREMTTSATVHDGQTLVLGNLSDESVVAGPNGAIWRQLFTDKKKKQLIVFLTVTIIDPSGNRLHEAPHSRDYYDGASY